MIAASGAIAMTGKPQPAVAGSSAPTESRDQSIQMPAIGEALSPRVKVFSRPRSDSDHLKTMKSLRYDFRPTVFFVTKLRDSKVHGPWYRIEVPGRPNGGRGWVRATLVRLLHPVGPRRIVIDRSSMRLRLTQGSRTILRAPVAVGKPSAPTPVGRFYVTAEFAPSDDFLGPWAFETSAYAAITDWPRGGIVGLHGTSAPGTIGHRSSHGCIRTFNWAILKLRRLVEPGTPLIVKR